MGKYTSYNINLDELEKDYGEGILRDYIKTRSYVEKKYIENNYKIFMKNIKGISEYKMQKAHEAGKYGGYMQAMADMAREDNSIDMYKFKEQSGFSDSQYKRLVSTLNKCDLIRKNKDSYYINPLFSFYGADIRVDLGLMFEDQLNMVGISVR